MPGRNETRSGRRFPRTGPRSNPAANNTSSTGSWTEKMLTFAWAPNRNRPAYIVKTFHSSGTPIGTLNKMNPWNANIIVRPTAVGNPPWLRSKMSGNVYSTAVPPWASSFANLDGRRSSGKLRYIAVRIRRDFRNGELLTITVTTPGKWWLSFDVAAPHQTATWTSFDPAM